MAHSTEDVLDGTCGARADEVGGPAEWLCVLPLGHHGGRFHETASGEMWGPSGALRGDPDTASSVSPATIAEAASRVAAGLEIMPGPTNVVLDRSNGVRIQVSTAAAWEAWRQWIGAAEVKPGEWAPYRGEVFNGRPIRCWETSADWRGLRFTLVRHEFGAMGGESA